jgi:uncharacterized YigZ family protein
VTHTYRTVRQESWKEIVIQKSRFIGYSARTSTVEEAQHFIDKIRKKHHNATHNCVAYIIGKNDEHQKANDDGEPSGTAGKPMLEFLKKVRLKDTTVVVTRYFGGIKLGAGGLIRAYGQAAKAGVLSAGVIERRLHREILVMVDYHWHGKLQHEWQQKGIRTGDPSFAEHVTMSAFVEDGEEGDFIKQVHNVTNGQADCIVKSTHYVDIPVHID